MNEATFREGMRRLQTAFDHALDKKRLDLYRETLIHLPGELFVNGVQKLIAEWKPFGRKFPVPAEIGEACLPGQRVTEEMDATKQRTVIRETPWTYRLQKLNEGPSKPRVRLVEDDDRPFTPEDEKKLKPEIRSLMGRLKDKWTQQEEKRHETPEEPTRKEICDARPPPATS